MSTVHSKSKNNNSNVQNQTMEHNAVKNTWLNAVIEQKKFNISKIVDDCYVRAYLSVKLPESSKKITVTVWKEDYIGSRLTPWINFKNKNVMPLLQSETISNLNAVLTYTIPGQCSLQGRLNSEEFRHSNKALNKIMMSVLEVADGLKYLHKMGYTHMNIKASAITIVHDDTIKIDNFQFLSPINTAQRGTSITSNGLQQSLCPPETFYHQENANKYLMQFDSWAVGIMIIELCTGGYLTKKLPKHVDSWCTEVYPVLHKILKKKKFEKRFHKYFPDACRGINLRAMRILAANILTLHPSNRPAVSEIHKMLSNLITEKNVLVNTKMYKEKPKIWKRKMHWNQLMTETAHLAQEELNYKWESVDESILNISEDIENMASGNMLYDQDNFTKDLYAALREEISKYYGTRILQVPEDEVKESEKKLPSPERNIYIDREEEYVKEKEFIKTEKESSEYSSKLEEKSVNRITRRWAGNDEINEGAKMFPSPERNISMEKEEGFIKTKDFIKSEKECSDYSTKFQEHNKNRLTRSWKGNILSKLINFGDLALKYVPDPWMPENSDTYLNRLSKQLTG